MPKLVEVALPDQLVTEVKPILLQNKLNLNAYILKAVRWYTFYHRQNSLDPIDEEQNILLAQIRNELAPYAATALQTALGDEEADWEALLA